MTRKWFCGICYWGGRANLNKSISGHTIEFHGLTGIIFSNTDELNNQT